MSVRRPLWVQCLAFVIFELTDPAGAARLRMSRGVLNEAGEGPSGRRAGLDDPASLSALTEGLVANPRASRVPAVGEDEHDLSGQTWPAGCLASPSVSASDHAVEPAWHPPTPTGGPAVRLVPGLDGRAQLLLFAAVFFGPTLGWALGVIFGADL